MENKENDMVSSFKKQSAYRAVDFIKSGMVIGLGSGTTALYALQRLAELIKSGKLTDIVGVPSSLQTERIARELTIPLTTLTDHPEIDVTIDGADEVDPDLNVIKGGGGAHWREKIIAQASRRVIIMVDESKLSPMLGTRWTVPVEVPEFGWRPEARYLESLNATVVIRRTGAGTIFTTDQDNYILDCNFGPITALEELVWNLNQRAGIIEHGIFLELATDVIVSGERGIQHLQRKSGPRITSVNQLL